MAQISKMYQTVENLGGVSFHNKLTMNHGTLRNALLYVERHYGATLLVNGYVMPSMDDDTFFYSSVKAAEEDKVWVEEAHAFMSLGFKSALEGGCIDLDEEFEEFGGWDAFVLDNIYRDIFGYEPMTGEDGHAIVYDKDVAEMCEKAGYEVLPCGNPEKILEDGTADEWWMIFPVGGEEQYFRGVYEEDGVDDEEDEDEKILDITATASVIKPIAKSIYRAWAKGLIEWEGFTVCPLFNMTKVYNLTLYKGKHGYSMYVTPLNENTDWKEFLIDLKEEGAITPEDEGYIIDEDNYWIDKNMRAEKLSVDKDRSKGRSNNSRRSKGIHKDRKNYKKLKNRRSRHQSKKVLKNYNMKIDFEGVEHYFEDIYGCGWSVYVRHSLRQGWIYENYFNEYRAKGVEVDLEYFEEDEDGYYRFDRTLDFLSVSELIKLGFAE